MIEAKGKSSPRFLNRVRRGCASVACVALVRIFIGCHSAPEPAMEEGPVTLRVRPVDLNPGYAEQVGRIALEKIGYVPIMDLARRAGWVAWKEVRSSPGVDRALISMDGVSAASAGEFAEVF
jgi:hypothetical protein